MALLFSCIGEMRSSIAQNLLRGLAIYKLSAVAEAERDRIRERIRDIQTDQRGRSSRHCREGCGINGVQYSLVLGIAFSDSFAAGHLGRSKHKVQKRLVFSLLRVLRTSMRTRARVKGCSFTSLPLKRFGALLHR